jgi:hypothetical protein
MEYYGIFISQDRLISLIVFIFITLRSYQNSLEIKRGTLEDESLVVPNF